MDGWMGCEVGYSVWVRYSRSVGEEGRKGMR